jgi:surfactin synthase thioesterase subunit
MNNNISPWFTTYNQPMKNQARVFAFPYSGAGSSAYHQWASYFSQRNIDFIGMRLPARENRMGEEPVSNLSLLINSLSSEIIPFLNKPFVFFGHSLGALIAFELCRALRKKGASLPAHLFVSAFHPPSQPNPNKALHQLAENEFIDGIRAYGNTSEKVLSNALLMELLLPMLRADFALHETYHYKKEPPLSCPITVFKGDQDNFAKARDMSAWQQETNSYYEEIEYRGGHFFLNDYRESIGQKLITPLNQYKEDKFATTHERC